jgi:hypothetical protein
MARISSLNALRGRVSVSVKRSRPTRTGAGVAVGSGNGSSVGSASGSSVGSAKGSAVGSANGSAVGSAAGASVSVVAVADVSVVVGGVPPQLTAISKATIKNREKELRKKDIISPLYVLINSLSLSKSNL